MKKTYEKPTVMYESFQLAQNIASCDVTINSMLVDTCEVEKIKPGTQVDGIITPGGFTTQNGECGYYISDFCYTNASGFVVVHAS